MFVLLLYVLYTNKICLNQTWPDGEAGREVWLVLGVRFGKNILKFTKLHTLIAPKPHTLFPIGKIYIHY